MLKAMRNCLIAKFLIRRGSVVLNTAVMFSPVAMVLAHSGDDRMRLTRLMSFPCNIFFLSLTAAE